MRVFFDDPPSHRRSALAGSCAWTIIMAPTKTGSDVTSCAVDDPHAGLRRRLVIKTPRLTGVPFSRLTTTRRVTVRVFFTNPPPHRRSFSRLLRHAEITVVVFFSNPPPHGFWVANAKERTLPETQLLQGQGPTHAVFPQNRLPVMETDTKTDCS